MTAPQKTQRVRRTWRTPMAVLGCATWTVAAYGAAMFSDANWLPLGSGLNGAVNALAVSGNTLYAGGSFTKAGGNAANYIAQWNGSSWSALGSGIGGLYPCVYALAVSGSTLYAGGQFTTAGGNAANYIAQWNGSSWSALGSGMNGGGVCAGGVGQQLVCGRRVHDGGRHRGQLHRAMEREQLVGAGFGDGRLCVCAGGVGQHAVCGRHFTTAGQRPIIAQWNGSSWSALVAGGGNYLSGYPSRALCARWRCRAARCMRAAVSRRRAATRPITSPNGTGAVGRRWVRG